MQENIMQLTDLSITGWSCLHWYVNLPNSSLRLSSSWLVSKHQSLTSDVDFLGFVCHTFAFVPFFSLHIELILGLTSPKIWALT